MSGAGDPTGSLLAAMAAHDLHPKSIVWNGTWQRFPGIGKTRGTDAAYIADPDQERATFHEWGKLDYQHWFRGRTKPRTPEEIERAKREAARRVEEAAELYERQQHAIRRAWDSAGEATLDHPYIKAKGIAPPLHTANVRQLADALLVPMRFPKGNIVGLQRIYGAGRTKPFDAGSRAGGAYASISSPDGPRDTLYVAEGWATGASVHQATGRPVVVAFSAGNLVAVAEAMREKYPERRIVVAADNDRWTSITLDGAIAPNPGVAYARKAANSVPRVEVAIPDFRDLSDVPEGEKGPTDFNDLHRREGIKAVRRWLNPRIAHKAVVEADATGEAPPPDPDNKEPPVVTGRKNDPRTFLRAGQLAGQDWYYDLRRDRPLRLNGDGEWGEVTPRWVDNLPYIIREKVKRRDQTRRVGELDYSAGMSKRLFSASLDRCERDPFRTWLESLPDWDGADALDCWLEVLEPAGDPELVRWCARIIPLLAVWRTFRRGTGCKHTAMLIGPSHGGKSSLLECLVPPEHPDWYRGTLPMQYLNVKPKEVVEHTKGAVVVEWAEMGGLSPGRNAVDADLLKAYLSASRDSGVRFAYRRDPEDLPRAFVIVGTANPTVHLPNDAALLNRFVPVVTTSEDRPGWRGEIEAYMAENRKRIWAEALARFREGMRPTLPHRLRRIAREAANALRYVDTDVESVWHAKRNDIWEGQWFVEWSAIREHFPSDVSADRIKRFLEAEGWTWQYPRRNLLPRRWGYVQPGGRPQE